MHLAVAAIISREILQTIMLNNSREFINHDHD